ncbi:hypothetical protein B0H12DRAFT_1137335 [Mycena haematopus]|nr:hypothetical protein B0H12DRAFT_1137335 [Mycena haematopus]
MTVCIDGPGTCLVLKINQLSICRGILSDLMDECYDPRDLVYCTMKHGSIDIFCITRARTFWPFDGSESSRFLFLRFVCLQTVTPCEEEAFVLVFEFIPGLTLNDVADSASISNLRNFVSPFNPCWTRFNPEKN